MTPRAAAVGRSRAAACRRSRARYARRCRGPGRACPGLRALRTAAIGRASSVCGEAGAVVARSRATTDVDLAPRAEAQHRPATPRARRRPRRRSRAARRARARSRSSPAHTATRSARARSAGSCTTTSIASAGDARARARRTPARPRAAPTGRISGELGPGRGLGPRPVSISAFRRCSASTMLVGRGARARARGFGAPRSARLASKKSCVESSAVESALFTSWPRWRSSSHGRLERGRPRAPGPPRCAPRAPRAAPRAARRARASSAQPRRCSDQRASAPSATSAEREQPSTRHSRPRRSPSRLRARSSTRTACCTAWRLTPSMRAAPLRLSRLRASASSTITPRTSSSTSTHRCVAHVRRDERRRGRGDRRAPPRPSGSAPRARSAWAGSGARPSRASSNASSAEAWPLIAITAGAGRILTACSTIGCAWPSGSATSTITRSGSVRELLERLADRAGFEHLGAPAARGARERLPQRLVVFDDQHARRLRSASPGSVLPRVPRYHAPSESEPCKESCIPRRTRKSALCGRARKIPSLSHRSGLARRQIARSGWLFGAGDEAAARHPLSAFQLRSSALARQRHQRPPSLGCASA